MSKLVMVDGRPHRWRRGKLVPIPSEWCSKVTSQQTINKRPSKLTGKARRALKRLKPEPPDDAPRDRE